jgi:hypothetical protein
MLAWISPGIYEMMQIEPDICINLIQKSDQDKCQNNNFDVEK